MSKKILILDDEPEYLLAMEKFLVEIGYSICITMSSKQALEIVKNEKPDFVLFDYKIPDMDGESFLRKAKEVHPSMYSVLITAWHDPVVLENCKRLGVNDIMLKPINLEELLNKIRVVNSQQKTDSI